MLATLLCASFLSACGGGNDSGADLGAGQLALGAATPAAVESAPAATGGDAAATAEQTGGGRIVQGALAPVSISGGGMTIAPLPASTPSTPGTPTTVTGGVTTLQLSSTATVAQVNVPVTFGQVFRAGDVPAGQTLVAKLRTASTPLQVDVKARHPDGSLRHAVLSTVLPSSLPAQVQALTLSKQDSAKNTAGGSNPNALLNAGFTASVSAIIGGQAYSASAHELLKSGKYTTWLAGSVATEWQVSAPLKNAAGQEHPHLAARYAIRYYPAAGSARVDVTVENAWSHEPSPQNFTYDAKFQVGGTEAYNQAALTHYHHARWRKLAWWGKAPQVDVRHDTAYLISTKAVANYDQSLKVSESTLAAMQKSWLASKRAPMGNGLAEPYMPTTGGRDDIGLLPRWAALYLLTMDPRAKDITVAMSDLAGGWGAHYRNKATGRPVTLQDYPYMTIAGNVTDTMNPVTKKLEAFPACPATLCTTPLVVDSAHQPNFSYLPYIITGDAFHLEELQFYAMWNSFWSNPYYRENVKGLLTLGQVRGLGWTMRTAGEAAYITPDADPLKAQFTGIVNDSLDWFNKEYSNNPSANALGAIVHSYSIVYDTETALAPWQDDIFTMAIGHLTELGFEKSKPLLAYKTRFAVDRMTAPGACWINASAYTMKVRDTNKSAVYSSMAQVYKATNSDAINALVCNSQQMAFQLKLLVSEMVGYSSSVGGYPSYMQPALAYGVGVRSEGQKAWTLFQSRANKPDYSTGPQYAIIPR